MADNQNTTPNNPGINRDQTRQIVSDVREVKKEQGDFNDVLKESINLLKKIDRSYEDIQSRIQSLDKTQINIKQISNELYKAKQKELTTSNRLLAVENKLEFDSNNRIKQYMQSQAKIAELETRKYQYERNALKAASQQERQLFLDKAKDIDYILDKQTARNIRLKDGLSIQEAEVVALRQANDVAKQGVVFGEESLQLEKQTSKQLGISGNLVKGLANKLGVGTEAYEAMTVKARKLAEDDIKRKTIQKQLAEAQKSGNQDQIKSLNEQLGLLGKERGAFSKKLAVVKEGAKAGASSIKDSLSDPVTRAGLVVGAYKLVESGLTAVGNAAAKAGNFMAGLTEDSSNIVRGLTSGLSDLARKIPLVGGLIGGLVDGFSALLDLVIGVDDKIIKAGRQLNMTANEARAFNRSLQDASFNSNNIFVNSKKLLESQVELTNQLGIVNTFNKEILETNIMLKDFAGLEADVRQRIVELSMVNGKTAQNTTKTILAQVEGLKKATGIEFQSQKILKEIASQSGYIGLQFTKYPAQLTKSLLTVKSMGLELKDLDSMASSFLDFESSISKEFEAQLLTGKNINLTKAREAFLNNDLVTAASEITRQIGTSEDFLKLNRIQAESLADAFGMSRDQLGEMLRQQEILAVVGGKQGDTAKKQLELGRQKYQNEKALAAALGEQNYQALIQGSTQEKIAAFIEKIKQSVVDFVERTNIIEKIENFVKMLQDPKVMQGLLGKIRDTMSTFIKIVGEVLADVIEVGGEIANLFTFGPKGDEREKRAYELGAKIRAGAIQMSENIGSIGGNLKIEPKKETVKPETSSNTNTTPIDKTFKKPIEKIPTATSENIKPIEAKKDVASLEDKKVKNEVQIITVTKQPDNREMPIPVNNKDMVINLHYHNADEINTFSTKLGKGISIDTQFGHSGYTVANNNAI